MKLYTISPCNPYLEDIARFILERFENRLEQTKIFFPSRKACRFFQEILINQSKKDTLILPDILPLDELETNKTLIKSPLISKLKQQMILAKIILSYQDLKFNISQALDLASRLSNIFSETNFESINIKELVNIQNLEISAHWSVIANFIIYVHSEWQNYVNKFQRTKAENTYSINNFDNLKNPIIIAGTFGHNKTTRNLIKKISLRHEGYVILPPIEVDDTFDPSNIKPGHAHWYLAKLLEFCNLTHKSLIPLDSGKNLEPSTPYLYDIYNTNNSNKNNSIAPKNINLITVDNEHKEALLLPLLIKDIKSKNPDAKIAIIANNRSFEKKVMFFCMRFNLNIDHGISYNLSHTRQIQFILALYEAVMSNFNNIKLLALLKHSFIVSPYVYQLEKLIFRAYQCDLHPTEIKAQIEKLHNEQIASWLFNIIDQLDILIDVLNQGKFYLKKILSLLIKTAEILVPNIWNCNEGKEVAEFLRELLDASQSFGYIDKKDFVKLLSELAAGTLCYQNTCWNPSVILLPPEEALFTTSFDYVIITDMNEGTWPNIKIDPFANKAIRENMHLDNDLGISNYAYNFYYLIHKKHVFLTRSTKKNNIETTISRFILGLTSHLKEDSHFWEPLINKIFSNKAYVFTDTFAIAKQKDFPLRIAATHIETLLRNPYGFYARKILQLEKLKEVNHQPGSVEFGSFLHSVFDRYSSLQTLENQQKNYAQLLEIAEDELDKINFKKKVQYLWWPRIKMLAKEFIKFDYKERLNYPKIYSEIQGEITLNILGKQIQVTAKADRIGVDNNHNINIIDYKTGLLPSLQEVSLGLSPQMLIEFLIASKGGFKAITKPQKIDLTYVKVSISKPYIQAINLNLSNDILETIEERLSSLLEFFLQEQALYYSCPNPKYAPRYNDYALLARHLRNFM